MTNTYAPELTQLEILNSIYYWTSQGTWAPGIAFPAGSTPPNDSSVHDRDFFFKTTDSHLYQYQGGDYPNGSWVDLQEAANAILSCGTTLPGSGSEGDLFNKYDTGIIYQWINGAWRNIGSNKGGLPLGADSINFTDNYKTWRFANLGLLLVSDDGFSSILATDQSFLAKKDIAAGGFLSTNQGEVWMGHGRANASDVPKIVLMHSESGYDTLSITESDCSTPANMKLKKLTAGSASGGLWITLNDIDTAKWALATGGYRLNFAKHVSGDTFDELVAFYLASGSGGIQFAAAGGGTSPSYDVNLYRGGAGVLQTDDFIKINHAGANITFYDINLYRQTSPSTVLELSSGMIIDGALNVAGISCNGALGVTGNANITGNLGVGTSSPATKLHVKGGWLKVGDDGTADNSIQLETQTGFHRISFKKLHFYEWDYGDIMMLDNGSLSLLPTGASINFGGDITLYRQTSPSVCLELNDDMIIDGSLQVGSGLSVTGNMGATGNITANGYVHGGGSSGNAFKIGDDCYLVDINQANVIGVRGAYNSNIGGFRLGNSNWTQLKNDGAILYFQTYTSTGGILPSTGGYYTLGSSSKDWSYVYANYLRYDVNCVEYDALDDLALVKNHKSKTVIDKQSGEEITVIDMKESFPFLLADDNHIAHEKLQGYMLGCVKALAKKQDEHDALLLKLLNEVKSLRATTSLKGEQQ